MSDLTGQKPRDTYGRLLQIANANDGADGTLRAVSDGKGDATALFLSTSQVGVGAASANYWTATGTSGEELTFTATGTSTDIGFLFAAKNNGRLRARRMQAQATSLTPVSGVLPFVQQGIVNSLSGTITSGVSGPFSWVVSADTANALNAEGGNIYYMFGGNTFGGTAMRGGRIGLNISHSLGSGNTGNLSTETWFQTGISSQTVAAFRDGGVQNEYSGHLFGMFASSELRPGARFWNEIKAVEYNVSADAGSSVGFKFGITATMSTTDAVEADVEEAFLAIGSRKANAAASTGMRSGIIYGGAAAYWGIPEYGALIEATPSTVTGSTPPPMTAAYGIDWSLVTFGASLIRSANFGVDGSGNTGGVVTAGTTLQARDGLRAVTATLASVTVTDGGTFTAFPTLTVAAPLGGGGSTATATVATMGARTVRDIAAAGTGYAVNDVLTVVGGTSTATAQIKVLEVTVTGGITAAEIQTAGDYSVLPSSPFTVTGGAGTGAQFRIGWRILTVTRTAGSGYQQFPAPVITADTAAMIRRPKLVAVMTGAAAALNIGNNYANFATFTGAASGGTFDASAAALQAAGADTHIDFKVLGKGNGRLNSTKLYVGGSSARSGVSDATVASIRTDMGYTTSAAPGLRVGGNFFGTATTGQVLYNIFAIDADTVDCSTGGGPANATGLYVGHTVSAGAKGGRVALNSFLQVTGAVTIPATGMGSFVVSAGATAEASANGGGTAGLGNGRGNLFGGNWISYLKSGATFWSSMIGGEMTIGAQTGSSVYYKNGFQIVLDVSDAVGGTGNFDTGLLFTQQINGASPGWDMGISFGHELGWWPMSSAGTLIGTEPSLSGLGPSYAAAWGIDFSAVTFSSGFLKSTGFEVNGSGVATMASAVIGTSGPTIRAGTGAASGTQPRGSLWFRTDGGVGTTLYVSQGGGTWNAVAGV